MVKLSLQCIDCRVVQAQVGLSTAALSTAVGERIFSVSLALDEEGKGALEGSSILCAQDGGLRILQEVCKRGREGEGALL